MNVEAADSEFKEIEKIEKELEKDIIQKRRVVIFFFYVIIEKKEGAL